MRRSTDPATFATTPLCAAVLAGDAVAVHRLLALGKEKGGGEDKEQDPGQGVLHRSQIWSLLALAIDTGNVDVVQELLRAGAARPSRMPVDVGAFQAVLSTGNVEMFRLLLTHSPGVVSPDFVPDGMAYSKKLRWTPTLWQAVLEQRPAWLPDLLARRHASQPLTVAQVLSVARASTNLTVPVLEAFACASQHPGALAGALAATYTKPTYQLPSQPQAAAEEAASADIVAHWALGRGATLEDHPALLQGKRPQDTTLAHLAAIAPETGKALPAWVRTRSRDCPLEVLDGALQSAALHLRADTYTLLAQARAARPDAQMPMTPGKDGMWLSVMLTRLLSGLAPESAQDGSVVPKEVAWRLRAPAFLTAFCSFPFSIASPYLDLCTAMVSLRGPRPGSQPIVISATQADAIATLYAHWLDVGAVPSAADRAQLRAISPELMASLEAQELQHSLPGVESPPPARARM